MMTNRFSLKSIIASSRSTKWLLWASVNLIVAGYFVTGLVAPASSLKTSWLPGQTTHGHYQIEMDCDACHSSTNDSSSSAPSASDVMQDACIRCHGEQLKLVDDTHPAKKFRDPVNSVLLETLDAQNCLACHQEHLPERTLEMGLTMPQDYCWHCHQDVGDSRPSHRGMTYDSCSTAGCHNYHDNRALYEKFLDTHWGEMDFSEVAVVPLRDMNKVLSRDDWKMEPLSLADADGPDESKKNSDLMQDWVSTAHAAKGVNCNHCHNAGKDLPEAWSDAVAIQTCQTCHAGQVDSFLTGKHGMRIAAGLSPMTPSQARLPMHAGAVHAELDCSSCHSGHRFDTDFAAAEACLRCHADDHSLAYANTSHAQLWADEIAGEAKVGSGVSCATCHLPRLEGENGTWVNHDQNSGLRPNETMARQVCMNCHGLEFSLSSLASPQSKIECYGNDPEVRTESVQMAHDWFEQRSAKAKARKLSRVKK